MTGLDLEHNQIGGEGAKEIADALKNNQSLTDLVLGHNKIGDKGAKEIADALKKNKSLTRLVLDHNQIGDEGAKEIADALKKNQSLTSLDLDFNQISSTLKSQINKLIERNRQIRDNFLALAQQAIRQETEANDLLNQMVEVPLAHQIYALEKIKKEVKELQKQNKDFARHLEIIELLNANLGIQNSETQSQPASYEEAEEEIAQETSTPESPKSTIIPDAATQIQSSQPELVVAQIVQSSLSQTKPEFSEEKLTELQGQYQSLQQQLLKGEEQSQQSREQIQKQLQGLEFAIAQLAIIRIQRDGQEDQSQTAKPQDDNLLKLDAEKKERLEKILHNHQLVGEFAGKDDVARFYLPGEDKGEVKAKINSEVIRIKADPALAKFYTDIKYYLGEIFTSAMIADVVGVNRVAILGNNVVDFTAKGLAFAADELPGGSVLSCTIGALARYCPDQKFSKNYKKLTSLCGDGINDQNNLIEALAIEIVKIFEQERQKGDEAEIKKQRFRDIFDQAKKKVQQLSPNNQNIKLKLSNIDQQAAFYGTKMVAAIFNGRRITGKDRLVVDRDLVNGLVEDLKATLGNEPTKPTVEEFHADLKANRQQREEKAEKATLEQRVGTLEGQLAQAKEVITQQGGEINDLKAQLANLTQLVQSMIASQSQPQTKKSLVPTLPISATNQDSDSDEESMGSARLKTQMTEALQAKKEALETARSKRRELSPSSSPRATTTSTAKAPEQSAVIPYKP